VLDLPDGEPDEVVHRPLCNVEARSGGPVSATSKAWA
jgi:hypothetical protein